MLTVSLNPPFSTAELRIFKGLLDLIISVLFSTSAVTEVIPDTRLINYPNIDVLHWIIGEHLLNVLGNPYIHGWINHPGVKGT